MTSRPTFVTESTCNICIPKKLGKSAGSAGGDTSYSTRFNRKNFRRSHRSAILRRWYGENESSLACPLLSLLAKSASNLQSGRYEREARSIASTSVSQLQQLRQHCRAWADQSARDVISWCASKARPRLVLDIVLNLCAACARFVGAMRKYHDTTTCGRGLRRVAPQKSVFVRLSNATFCVSRHSSRRSGGCNLR